MTTVGDTDPGDPDRVLFKFAKISIRFLGFVMRKCVSVLSRICRITKIKKNYRAFLNFHGVTVSLIKCLISIYLKRHFNNMTASAAIICIPSFIGELCGLLPVYTFFQCYLYTILLLLLPHIRYFF